jgi:hypothetical protein
MAQQQGIDASQPTGDDQSPERAHTVAYNLLMRQSRKLGQTATRTIVSAKSFLQKEVTMPGAEKLFQGFSRTEKKEEVKKGVDELKKIVQQSHEVLAEVQTVFPITLFPDKLCLDRSVITITKRNFFWSSNTISVRVEDVLNVSTTIGPIFGSLTVAIRVMNSVDHYEINFLWRQDAIELKHMIQGYMIAKHSGLDIDHLSAEELVDTLHDLGKDNGS